MKKGLITMLIIAMLACIGLVSCKNEVEMPAEELVSVSFENESSRALTASIEDFKPETYYWKYAAKKVDSSNLVSGQTAYYDTNPEADARWIEQGQKGFGTTSGGVYTPFQVQGFSQGLWDFTLFAYNDADGTQLVYSGEVTAVLIQKGGNHTVSAVVSPAGSGTGTLKVLVEEIKLDAAAGAQVVANARIKLGIKTYGSETYDVKSIDFVTENYTTEVEKGQYHVDIQFTNDDGLVVYASGSVIATVYSGLTTTVSGSLSEALSYAEFAATSDVIATTIGTKEAIVEDAGVPTDIIKLVKKSSTDTGKVSASLSNGTAQQLITDLKTAYDADSSHDSSLVLNLSVDTTAATETTITYEIGMEAVLTYIKDEDEKTTTSNVGEVADFVMVQIELQRGLTDVKVTHSDDDMTECNDLDDLKNKTKSSPGAAAGFYYYQDPYVNGTATDNTKAMLYIRTYTFSPFTLSYTVPETVATVGSKTFNSLEDAFALQSTVDEYTIVLQKRVDITFDNNACFTVTNGKTITLDLNGYEVYGVATKAGTSAFIKVNNGGTLIVTDSTSGETGIGSGKIELLATDPDHQEIPGYASNLFTNYGHLIIESGKYVNSTAGAGASYVIDAYDGVTDVNNGYLSQPLATCVRLAMFNSGHPVVNIYDGLIEADGYPVQPFECSVNSSCVLNIKGGNIKGLDGYALYAYSYNTRGDLITVNISGGTFTGRVLFTGSIPGSNISISEGSFDIGVYHYGSDVKGFITGGTFNAEPDSAFIADGYFAKKVDGKYVIKPISEATDEDYIVSIGEQKYLKFSDALSAASDGATILFLKACSVSPSVNKNVIIDLNGKTIDGSFNIFSDNVTLKGGSIVGSSSAVVIKADNPNLKSKLAIDDVSIMVTDDDAIAMKGNAILEFKGSCSVTALGDGCDAIFVTYTGNEIVGSGSVLLSGVNADLHLAGKEGIPGSLEMNGTIGITCSSSNDKLVVDAFSGGEMPTLVVKGGTYNVDPTSYLANGYYAEHHDAVDPVPESWVVKQIPADAIFALIDNESGTVSYITSSNFESITGFAAGANPGVQGNHTLKLLTNYTLEISDNRSGCLVTFAGDNITFDLNTYTFTVDAINIENVLSAPNCKNLTITNGTIATWYPAKQLFYEHQMPDTSTFTSTSVSYVNVVGVPN